MREGVLSTVTGRGWALDRANSHVTAVVMTSYATKENTIDALRAGAGDFLPKPFDPEDLLQAVGNVQAARGQQAADASPGVSRPTAGAG